MNSDDFSLLLDKGCLSTGDLQELLMLLLSEIDRLNWEIKLTNLRWKNRIERVESTLHLIESDGR
jgi:hypothetical protein